MIKKGKLIGEGNTAEIYEYEDNKILKLYKIGIDKSMCIDEFNVTKSISNSLKICPMAYKTVYLENRIGAIYEKIEGKTMLKHMIGNIFSIERQGKNLAKYHKEIHKEIKFELHSAKDKLKYNIKRVMELNKDEKEKLYSYLDELPNGNILCHFDFHPDNIIMRGKKPIIIDWMTACVGCEEADVARTSVILKYGQVESASKIVKKMINKFQKKIYLNYIDEYLKISNIKLADIKKWEIPIAAARLTEGVSNDEKLILLDIVHKAIG